MRNIIACRPGRGPHADQYIVIGAHYDHIGFADQGRGIISGLLRGFVRRPATAPTTRPYYPGADDNASGTAGLLELARLYSQANRPPRTLMFIAFAGEELGMQGSRYFMEHSPVPLNKIVAMVNLDMLGRLRDDALTIGGSGTAAVFPAILSRCNSSNPPMKFQYLWNNGLAPSDNDSFARRSIPVLFFNTGMHMDLHKVSDTADKINYAGEARVVDLAARVIHDLMTEKDLQFTVAPPATRPSTRPMPSAAPAGK